MSIDRCIKDLQCGKGFKYQMAAKHLYESYLFLLKKSDSILTKEDALSIYLDVMYVVIEDIMNPEKEIRNIDRYFIKVFVNKRNTEIRNRMKREVLHEQYRFHCNDTDQGSNLELSVLVDLINNLKELSNKEKIVFSLYFLNDKNHEQISNELDISVSNSKTILFRAKTKIRKYFKSRESFIKLLA